jgi:hypothetical protein
VSEVEEPKIDPFSQVPRLEMLSPTSSCNAGLPSDLFTCILGSYKHDTLEASDSVAVLGGSEVTCAFSLPHGGFTSTTAKDP